MTALSSSPGSRKHGNSSSHMTTAGRPTWLSSITLRVWLQSALSKYQRLFYLINVAPPNEYSVTTWTHTHVSKCVKTHVYWSKATLNVVKMLIKELLPTRHLLPLYLQLLRVNLKSGFNLFKSPLLLLYVIEMIERKGWVFKNNLEVIFFGFSCGYILFTWHF